MTELPGRLREIVGYAHVVPGEPRYERDVTGRFGGAAAGVVRPGSGTEVAGVLAACASAGIGVVPQGGNTGLVGGGVPRGGEVVLSLARLTDIGPLDPVARQITAGAGVTPAALAAALRGSGLALGVDFGARDAATLGGMVATDAGGAQVLRHGTMRARVAGLEAVLADGRVLRRLSGLPKDNAGYDLPQLLVGSEGTLAVITAVRLALVDEPHRLTAALLGMPSIGASVELVAGARRMLPGLQAAEVFDDAAMDLVDGAPRASAAARGAPRGLRARGDGRRRRRARRGAGRRRRRGRRRRHGAAAGAVALPRGAEPRGQRGRRPAQARRVGAAPGDGGLRGGGARGRSSRSGAGRSSGSPRRRNLHVNVLGLPPEDERVDETVLALVAAYGGSISAEHGVGVAKRRYLGLTRSPEELVRDVGRQARARPRSILNPGVLL